MRIRLTWTEYSISIFSFCVTDILSLTSLVNISIVVNGSVAFDFPILAFNWTSSWAHAIRGEIIRLFWYADVVFFAPIMLKVSFTKVLGVIANKLALLKVTEFTRISDLLSLTIIWMRTSIVWVIRSFTWDLIIFTCFYTETRTDFVEHVRSLWFAGWLDQATICIFSGWTANFCFIITIAFADNWTQFPIITGYRTSTFVRNTDFVLGAEMEYKSVWAYSSWTFSALDFVISTYVVINTRFTCFIASVFAVLPFVSGPLISSLLKLSVEGSKSTKDRMGQQ